MLFNETQLVGRELSIIELFVYSNCTHNNKQTTKAAQEQEQQQDVGCSSACSILITLILDIRLNEYIFTRTVE